MQVKAPALQRTQARQPQLNAVWGNTRAVRRLQHGVDAGHAQCSSARPLTLYMGKYAGTARER